MGLGTGALVAGLFGMNVSQFTHVPDKFDLPYPIPDL
jgi:hypothetical protein